VVWENLRFLDEGDDKETRKRILGHLDSTEQHLRTAFHRFLEGAVQDGKKTKIKLNGMPLLAWNPFMPDEDTKAILPVTVLTFPNDARITVSGYVIPSQSEFSSPEAFTEAKGAKSFQDGQGLYCYRNNRLIRTGGWLGIIAADPHMSLARLSFEFDSRMDAALGVNVVKSEIKLPLVLKTQLRSELVATTSAAKARYSAKGRKKAASVGELPSRANTTAMKLPRKHTATELAETLNEIAASNHLSEELSKLKQAVRDEALTIAQEIGW
jgi:Tfp pilus assembly major pilin PilA